MTRRRGALALGLPGAVVVALGVLWVWKPWVPPLEVAEPGPTGRRVDEAGVFANYYPVEGEAAGGVLVVGGSLGGISSLNVRVAEALQQRGYSVLLASYFGAPGQPDHLERVPLETFDRALAWLREQPEVRGDRLAVMGTSKGAEAALLIGLRHPELRAVVAAAPSSAVWPGINWNSVNGLNAGSSWTAEGKPVPHLPYASFHPAVLVGQLGRLYRQAPARLAEHPEAAIAIEDVRAPVLLICGELDRLWPACPMSRQLQERAAAAGGPPVRVLAFERVGHADLAPPYPGEDVGPRPRWGGSASDADRARAESWDAIVEFLGDRLDPT